MVGILLITYLDSIFILYVISASSYIGKDMVGIDNLFPYRNCRKKMIPKYINPMFHALYLKKEITDIKCTNLFQPYFTLYLET